MARYSWSEDAQRWRSLPAYERMPQALENFAAIHLKILKEYEVGASHMWHHEEFVGGAFAYFDPGQYPLHYEEIIKPEGRIHFAGEHASLYHAWIQGAFESGCARLWQSIKLLMRDLTGVTCQVLSLVKGTPPMPCAAKF